jgi:hypothetical protein
MQTTGPYERNSIRSSDLTSLRARGEVRDVMGADGKRPCTREPGLNEREKAAGKIWGWLETERSEVRVGESGRPPGRADEPEESESS